MVRYELDPCGHKQVGYGLDHATGVFLSIENYDIDEDSPDHFTEYRTGMRGLGDQVSEHKMGQLFLRYGVPEKHIRELLGDRIADGLQAPAKDKGTSVATTTKASSDEQLERKETPKPTVTGICVYCAQEAKKYCGRCLKVSGQLVYYCSAECQKADWSSAHQHFCGMHLPAKKMSTDSMNMSVLGMFFSENSSKPCFIEVRCTKKSVGGDYYWIPSLEKYLGDGHQDQRWVQVNEEKDNRPLSNVLLVRFRDGFLTDGSEPNLCLQTIIGKGAKACAGLHWNGPLIALKFDGNEISHLLNELVDVSISDGTDIVDFFKTYAKKRDSEYEITPEQAFENEFQKLSSQYCK